MGDQADAIIELCGVPREAKPIVRDLLEWRQSGGKAIARFSPSTASPYALPTAGRKP